MELWLWKKHLRGTIQDKFISTSFISFLIGVISIAWPVWASEEPIRTAPDPVSAQYVVALNIPPVPIYKTVGEGWCVEFVRAHGFEKYTGDAIKWIEFVDTREPSVGSVVVLSEGEIGHLAIVTSFTETEISIIEQNYEGLGIVSTRSFPIDYKHIIGYVTK